MLASVTRLQPVKATKKPTPIVKVAVEEFGDGEWHAIDLVVSKVDRPLRRVNEALRRSKTIKMETKKVGKSFHFRLFVKAGTVGPKEMLMKLGPIIEALQAEGRKSIVTMSPPTVAHLAHQLAELLKDWTK